MVPSPTPWCIPIEERLIGDQIFSADGALVACCDSYLRTNGDPRRLRTPNKHEQLANAEFIVKACNNYDKLIFACKLALAALTISDMKPIKAIEELETILKENE